jgi:hypothetical protein
MFILKHTQGIALFFGFLVLLGAAIFIYSSFDKKIDYQNVKIEDIYTLQQEIKKARESTETNNDKLTALTTEVGKLKGTVCTLQKQIITLGAVPEIPLDETCK